MTARSFYKDFWTGVGERFPDLAGAASTRYYADNEQRLFTEHFPALEGLKILKTDLWDEAKNTRILAWASYQGARAYGIDISEPIVMQARAAFEMGPIARHRLQAAVGDVRDLPFHDASFDAIYSMGTIEHFDETERAVEEIARVLKPGGRAIVGVPNRYDPFLRPLFVTVLQAVGLYGYGYEKSYSRRALKQMLENAGLNVIAETAILFIPGWLRMLDLACHSWCRPLAVLTGVLVRPFVFLDHHVAAVRRHGYLLATVVIKPDRKSHVASPPRRPEERRRVCLIAQRRMDGFNEGYSPNLSLLKTACLFVPLMLPAIEHTLFADDFRPRLAYPDATKLRAISCHTAARAARVTSPAPRTSAVARSPAATLMG